MTTKAKIALNPLVWVLTEREFELSVRVVRAESPPAWQWTSGSL